MKKTTLLLLVLQSMVISLQAQTTNYGTSSGTTGNLSSYFGQFAGYSATSTSGLNSFFGHESGRTTTTGFDNTAAGARSLYSNTTGYSNSAHGSFALYSNTTGYGNIAVGRNSLYRNTSGIQNTAVGGSSLYSNTVGNQNTAIGSQALYFNIHGIRNSASGFSALYSNTTGNDNVANGYSALYNNTSGRTNTASGYAAMLDNSTGTANSAVGAYALWHNTTGSENSGIGIYALYLNTTGSFNSGLGYLAGPSAATTNLYNTTALGSGATTTASNQVRIGSAEVTSIGGQVSWSTLSDGRFKRDVKEDVSGLEFINQLRPVSYTVDIEAIDKFLGVPDSLVRQFAQTRKKADRQSGFIAQEVEAIVKKSGAVFHGIEAPQNENSHYSIRYAEFVVPLVKAVQELTGVLEGQQQEIVALKAQLTDPKTNPGTSLNEASSAGAVLFQNNPNPFTVDTEIVMSLPEQVQQATLIVYNMVGKQLKVMPIRDRGKTGAKIQGQELQAGMYIYSLIADGKIIDTKRMILTGN